MAHLALLRGDGVLLLGQAAQHAPAARLAQVRAALLRAQRIDVRLARHVQPVVEPARCPSTSVDPCSSCDCLGTPKKVQRPALILDTPSHQTVGKNKLVQSSTETDCGDVPEYSTRETTWSILTLRCLR